MRWIIALAGLAACTGSSGFASDSSLSGDYHFSYAPPGGAPVSTDVPSTVFDDPAAQGACCLAVFRIGTSLTLRVGSLIVTPTYPDAATGACPAIASTDILIGDVAEGAQMLDAAAAAAKMFYVHDMLDPGAPADPCPQSVGPSAANELSEPIALTGQIKIDRLACAGGESQDGDCALQAAGSWAIDGVDQITGDSVLFTSGSFVAGGQRLE